MTVNDTPRHTNAVVARLCALLAVRRTARLFDFGNHQITCINRFFPGTEKDRVSAAAALEMYEDVMTGRPEIRENATSEADFDRSISTLEAQALVEITANSGVLSGLDNVAVQPRESGKQKPRKVRGSAIEDPE